MIRLSAERRSREMRNSSSGSHSFGKFNTTANCRRLRRLLSKSLNDNLPPKQIAWSGLATTWSAVRHCEPQAIIEYVNGRPVPQAQHDYHTREFARLKADRAFVARYLSGEIEARRELDRHIFGRKMRVGTLAEIEAWEKAHGKPDNAGHA
jgi:hypothetical protein